MLHKQQNEKEEHKLIVEEEMMQKDGDFKFGQIISRAQPASSSKGKKAPSFRGKILFNH